MFVYLNFDNVRFNSGSSCKRSDRWESADPVTYFPHTVRKLR